MLNPNARSLYTSALTPPPGMIFDEAIATTFSMDPGCLLEAPVYLALLAVDGGSEPDPLTVLEALRRYADRITVYVQRGRILLPESLRPNPLVSFLEPMIVEVSAPGGGVFHPKIWALRFISPAQDIVFYRLIVLTRNMTNDRSWDLSLQLEGVVGQKKQRNNEPLAHLLRLLPRFASRNIAPEKNAQAQQFADELYRVEWVLPAGFQELTFYLPGIKAFRWMPPDSLRMAVISPFCSDEALQSLASTTRCARALISRPETLAALKPETLGLFAQTHHLDDAAETDDGEELLAGTAAARLASGLHAKAYLFETQYYSRYTHLVVGSANATSAALNAAKNIEFLVELKGRQRDVGGIDQLLGEEGLGDYLVNFQPEEMPPADAEDRAACEVLECARACLAALPLSLACQPTDDEALWRLTLQGTLPALEPIATLRAWPVTVFSEQAAFLPMNGAEGPFPLGDFSLRSITGLVAFELAIAQPALSVRFVLNLSVAGIPEARNAAILQSVINNHDGFLRYLLLLLGNEDAAFMFSGQRCAVAGWLARLASGEEFPLLEELTRAWSRYPERLQAIGKLVCELTQGNTGSVIPDDFLKLWTVFETAMKEAADDR
ncbi:phospholipase D family protein [Cronobacter muytjensii]|uniref:phospholipase D family protein n=1 Tax=Cronobacter muytjensii TaxID=413501 RepID=UPI0034D6C3A6